jgi:hypothetical protein
VSPSLFLALLLAVNAERPPPPGKKLPREVVVLAAAPQEPNEPVFVLLCAGARGLQEGKQCRPPAMATKARRPREGEHTIGRPTLAAPCALAKSKRAAVTLEPGAPRGPLVAVWPAVEAHQLTPAEDLATRVPDSQTLVALEAAVQGTPIIDQSLVLDVDADGKEERLVSVRRKDGPAKLVLLGSDGAQPWRALPTVEAALSLRLLAVSDLDRDQQLELYVFAQLEAGWELSVLEADKPLTALACGPPKRER